MLRKNGHVIEIIDDYLHGVLERTDAEYVQEHCESCRICSVAMEEGRKRLAALESIPSCEASEELIQSTLRRVQEDTARQVRVRRSFLRFGLLAAAASLALVGGLHLYYLNLKPTPYDLRILGQNSLLADTDASIRIQLTDRDRGRPMQGIPVKIELLPGTSSGAVVRLASFTTDERGTGGPRFRLPDWSDGKYVLRVVADTPRQSEEIARTITLKRSWRLMLSTDKPVYQPGQTIHIRSLALRRPDLKPVAGQEAVFTITDPKGNVIFRQREATSRFGIAACDCPLATEISEGAYAITCKMGDTESKQTVEVKHYVLPKFKVDLVLDQAFYQPGQWVEGQIQARYFFGRPVAEGRYEVRVETPGIGKAGASFSGGNGALDADGKTHIRFRLPRKLIGRPQDSGDTRVPIMVTVIDSAGQRQSRTVSRVVTANPIHIEVIPEAGDLVSNIPNRLYLYTCYADGRPAQTRVAITGIPQEVTTSEVGAAMVEFTPTTAKTQSATPAETFLAIRATDEKGLTGRREVTLKCGQANDDFLVRPDKAVYRGGETMQLTVLASGSEPVFLDLLKDGQTLLTTSIGVNQGQGRYAVDLPADLCGTVELQAYRFGQFGIAVRKTRAVYILQANQLQVDTKLSQREYRPGGQAKLTVAVKDAEGKPAPGAISLAAVDEAIFSVLDQAPGMEASFFTLEQELLKPIYAIYPWSPDLRLTATPERRRILEQAIFARTARSVAGRSAIFQKMVDEQMITPRTLEVLNSEDLDELLDKHYVALSDELVSLIRNDSANTLRCESYPAKNKRIESQRHSGLEFIKGAWVVLGIGLVLGVVIALILWCKYTVLKVLVGLGMLLMLASILLPSLARARELSKRAVSLADLRGLDMALSTIDEDKAGQGITVNGVKEESSSPVRVREWFPETLLWRPEIVTNDQGVANVDIDLADSITTWRLTGSVVSGQGQLGTIDSAIRVFQPFFVELNLPVSLTRNDEVSVPAVVYNYLDRVQSVELTLDAGDWFVGLGEGRQHIELQPGQVRSVNFPIRVVKVGDYTLQVTARGEGVTDAVKRTIAVVPDGRPIEQVFNGVLANPAELDLTVPADAIEGSLKATLKIYPSGFSQLVEGLDAIFQMPYGCFEQTSSTTYPNVLALDYLRKTKMNVPAIEARARQYIHLGYQRLLGFEIPGGGFDWFGHPPANRTLTAYGLMEFEDMARVHDVDPGLINRTREWLLKQRNTDGQWPAEGHGMHEDPTRRSEPSQDANLSTTAYIAWAVFRDPATQAEAGPTMEYLLQHHPESISDPYVIALVANALKAMDPSGARSEAYLERLVAMKQVSSDGKRTSWSPAYRTTFYGCARSGEVEATALAALAFLGTSHATEIPAAINWLIANKDGRGTWQSTQATVLALKALVAVTGQTLAGERERRVSASIDNGQTEEIVIPADQADVLKQMDLSGKIATGQHHLTLSDRTGTGSIYQFTLRYHVPQSPVETQPQESLRINLTYGQTDVTVDENVEVIAKVTNTSGQPAPMVILDLPIPAGFALDTGDANGWVRDGLAAKYQLTPLKVIVYLREVSSKTIELKYHLRATMPVKLTIPSAKAYEYYNPTNQNTSSGGTLTVRPRA